MTTPELTSAVRTPDAVREVFEAVSAVLMAQARVEIDGFGTFELHLRKARRARNPRTGERIDVPPRTVVRFKPASLLRNRAAARE